MPKRYSAVQHDLKQPEIKEFPGENKDPTVYTIVEGNMIGNTTPQHMQAHAMPLEFYLRKVIEEARKYGDSIFHKYGEGGEIGWFPCGTANVVLRWNEHREIIKLFQKTGIEDRRTWWKGWFGRLYKTSSQGWWWSPPMQSTQSMGFQEAVCQFVRDKLIYRDIKVDVRTYID